MGELGTKCKGFDDVQWKDNVRDVAFQVALQKFSSDVALQKLLLDTQDKFIANCNKNQVWGTGFSVNDLDEESKNEKLREWASLPRAQTGKDEWTGANVLGDALMALRAHFRANAKNNPH